MGIEIILLLVLNTLSPVVIRFSLLAILVALFCVRPLGKLCAQPTDATYATSASSGTDYGILSIGSGSVTPPNDAASGTASADKKPNDKYSTISVSSTAGLVSEWLHLTFTTAATASTAAPKTVYIRISEVTSALLGSSMAITAYSTASGVSSPSTTLPSKMYYLADGTILMALTITSNFRSVRITLTSPVALGTNTMRVHYAFYNLLATNTSNPYPFNAADCGVPNVTSKSIEGGLLTIASIENPEKAIDGDPAISKSSFRVFLSVGNLALLPTTSTKLKQTFFFNGLSNLSEAVRVRISQSTGLVAASLLSQIYIKAYNGSDSVGSSQLVNNLIEIDLLNSVGTNPMDFFFAPKTSDGVSVAFDRIEVTLEIKGLSLGLGESFPLHIHDVRRVPDAPTAIDASVCTNVGTVALTAESPLSTTPGVTVAYQWYNVIRGGSAIPGAGQTYNVVGLTTPGTYTYYADVAKTGCEASVRRKVTVSVTLPPLSPPVSLKP